MIKLTISSSFIGTEHEVELDYTREEWDNLVYQDRIDIISMHVHEYVSVDLEDEDGERIEW